MVNIISFPGLGLRFEVPRSFLSIGDTPIFTYGILIALGVCLAFIYAVYESRRLGISQDDFLNMFLIGVPSAIVGARLYYVVFSWADYKNDLWEIFNIRGGGLAIYGGIIGAAISILIYCRVKKINKWKIFDLLSVGLLIGQGIGRWGNFVNGEAFGKDTLLPWAMTIERNGYLIAESVHPTFFYESVLNLLGAVILFSLRKKKTFDGELFCGYMIWYGSIRTVIEGLRADSLYIGEFRVSQLLSLLLVAIGIALIVINRKKMKKPLTKDEN